MEIDLNQTSDVTLRCKPRKENSVAVEVVTELPTRVLSNRYYVDETAKKKLKILTAVKVVLAIAIVVAVILAIIL